MHNNIDKEILQLDTKILSLCVNNADIAINKKEYESAIYWYLLFHDSCLNYGNKYKTMALNSLKNAWDLSFLVENKSLSEYILDLLSQYLNKGEIKSLTDKFLRFYLNKFFDNNYKDSTISQEILDSLSSDLMKTFSSNINNVDKDKIFNDNFTKALSNIIKKTDKKHKIDLPDDISEKISNVLSSAFSEPKGKNDVSNDNANNDASAFGNDGFYIKKNIIRYNNIVGYDTAIKHMRGLGIGSNSTKKYVNLIEKLNKEHGLKRLSFSKTIVFKSASRNDTKVFMDATASEINMPIIHMHMEESISGASVLCMMASPDANFKLNPARTGFNGKGILILEDVDTWRFPEINIDSADGMSSLMNAQISRGVAEVLNLIEAAVNDPNILVLASVEESVEDGAFSKLILNDYVEVLIDMPNEKERYDIWQKLADDHPSLRAFDLYKLTTYSKNMSRYDIEVAAHEAIEEAYKQGLEKKQYIPLTMSKIIEKLAEFQPHNSTEYKKLEEVAIQDFKKDLDDIDNILQ